MTYHRYGEDMTRTVREFLWSRYKPIYDDAFDDLLEKLNRIEFHPTKKS
jgi:hypothetical protein